MALGKESQSQCSQGPHWMRLLEEKYQRLHAKILNQASKFTHRRASTTTIRVLKESRKRQASSVAGPNLGELGKDQEENPGQFAEGGINETVESVRYVDGRAQVDRADNCLGKQATLCHGPRPLTQEGTRPKVFSDSTTGEGSYNNTPGTSGAVTRISSAFPRTRLSSAYDSSLLTPREVSNVDVDLLTQGHATQLDQALRLELEHQHEGWTAGHRLPTAAAEPESCAEAEDDDTGSGKMSIPCQSDRADVEAMTRRRRRHVVRPVKTSISRVSHKTSKSCPASFGQLVDTGHVTNMDFSPSASFSNASKQVPASVVPLTARGVQEGRMRVFARMSMEARHAVDETLKEMKMEEDTLKVESPHPVKKSDVIGIVDNDENHHSNVGDGSGGGYRNNDNASNSSLRNNVSAPTGDVNDPEGDRIPQRHNGRRVVTEDASSDVSIPSDDNSNYAIRGEARDVLTTTSKPLKPQPAPRFGRLASTSLTNGIGVHRNASVTRRLPQLDETTTAVCQDNNFPNPRLPLPSIKRANLAFRENTFEITPHGYDIRFRDIITCQKGDRDTPPLDIRQQSIEKCQQWLVQHTPRR